MRISIFGDIRLYRNKYKAIWEHGKSGCFHLGAISRYWHYECNIEKATKLANKVNVEVSSKCKTPNVLRWKMFVNVRLEALCQLKNEVYEKYETLRRNLSYRTAPKSYEIHENRFLRSPIDYFYANIWLLKSVVNCNHSLMWHWSKCKLTMTLHINTEWISRKDDFLALFRCRCRTLYFSMAISYLKSNFCVTLYTC